MPTYSASFANTVTQTTFAYLNSQYTIGLTLYSGSPPVGDLSGLWDSYNATPSSTHVPLAHWPAGPWASESANQGTLNSKGGPAFKFNPPTDTFYWVAGPNPNTNSAPYNTSAPYVFNTGTATWGILWIGGASISTMTAPANDQNDPTNPPPGGTNGPLPGCYYIVPVTDTTGNGIVRLPVGQTYISAASIDPTYFGTTNAFAQGPTTSTVYAADAGLNVVLS